MLFHGYTTQSRCWANCCWSTRRSLNSSWLSWQTNGWRPWIMWETLMSCICSSTGDVYYHKRTITQQSISLVSSKEARTHDNFSAPVKAIVSRSSKGSKKKSTYSKQSLRQLQNALRRMGTFYLNQTRPVQINLGTKRSFVSTASEQWLFYWGQDSASCLK